jgi:hypothetical protein
VFLSTSDDDLDDKNNVLQSRRDQIERVKESQEKRKTDFDLSQNTNTKKARNRLISFTSFERELKMRKIADRQIIDRAIRVLKRTIEYENATDEKKSRLIQKIKKNIVVKR